MGIYFPADQQREVVPRFYMPIELEDLESRLAQESERRRAAELNAPGLAEAIYVARLDGEQLTSDYSVWKFAGNPTPQSFTLGKVSVALRDARVVKAKVEQLSDYLRFDSAGAIELTFTEENAQRWFSFLATAEKGSDGKLFDLQFPPATIGKMLVATPKNYELSSEDVAIDPISNPTTHLPTDWPASLETARPFVPDVRWWLINLSGRSQFRISVNSVQAEGTLWYKHTLRKVETDYLVGEQFMAVNSKVELAASSGDYPLRIRMSQRMRIKTLLVDGVPSKWQSIASLSGESRLIEVIDAKLQSGTLIDIAANCDVVSETGGDLPDLAIAEAYAISGATRVRAGEGKTTDNVEAANVEFTAQPLIAETSEVHGYDDIVWTGVWIGSSPAISASFSRREVRWQASSMTRINIQSASLSANTRLQISANQLHSNEMRLQVGRDWFIDDINLISDSQGDIRTQFVELGNDDQRKTEIVISWERSRRNLHLELEIAAHRPREKDAESINLEMPKLVSIDEAYQQDIYVVESLGRYRVQLSQDLLQFQKQAREIPSWQQPLLPQLTDAWIFEGVGASIPNITLLASGGTFSSKTNAVLSGVASGFAVDYRITCQPISGSVDRLKLLFPEGFKPENTAFEFREPNGDNGVPVELVASQAVESSDALELEIQLPKAASTPFDIYATYSEPRTEGPKNRAESLSVYLPGVPGALTAECTLILPKAMAQFRGQPTLELLPASACCSAEQLQHIADSTQEQASSSFVAVRVDASESHTLRLNPFASSIEHGWIWDESLEHRVWDDGSQRHRVVWDVEIGERSQVKLKLPPAWRLERIFVDATELTSLSTSSGAEVEFGLPLNRRVQVTVECSSDAQADHWIGRFLTRIDVENPSIGIPVLVSKQVVLMPPSKVAIDSLATPRSTRLMDRLLPHSWWSLLAPNAFDRGTRQSERGWSSFEVRTDASLQPLGGIPSVWIVERSAVSALLIAVIMALGAFFWLVIGRRPRLWWLVAALLVVVTVLVPVMWLPVAQLALMSLCLAAFARMVAVITRRQTDKKRTSEIRSRSKLATDVRLTILVVVATGIAASNSLVAQESPLSFRVAQGGQGERGNTADSNAGDGAANVFGVLLPIDEDGNLSGVYAHIPTQLWQLLSAPDRDSAVAGPPKILSAEYALATRPNSVGERDSIQEFSVEFRVQVLQVNSELRLPFNSNELRLVDARVKDREVLVGLSTIKQEEDAVVFRSPELGTMPIKLRFAVNPANEAEEAPQLSVSIPPVPNARLRIDFTGNPKFDVNAIGGTERTATGELLSYLGPISRLNVWWSDPVRRVSPGSPVDIGSETWIHSSGSKVMAACQLRIGPQQSLPSVLNVNIDADWEPVGTDWGDAELISSEISTFRKRVVYRIQLADKPSGSTPRAVRVLLVPRALDASASLSLPFLSLQEVSEQSIKRVLAWSQGDQAMWKPDGVDFWPELASSAADWGRLALAAEKRVYRVAPGTGALQLRRQASVSLPVVNEMTIVRLDEVKSEIQYQAAWENTSQAASILRLRIPQGAKVTAVLLDGSESNYRVSMRGETALLLVPIPTERVDQISLLDVTLAVPTQLEKPTPLPRIVLEDVAVRRSLYRLFRVAAVECQLTNSGSSDLQLSPVALSSTKLLDGLELLIGEVDLGEAFREDATLPLVATISRQPHPRCRSLVMTLNRGADGWSASVFAEWDADSSLDFAYFDLPISIRDHIDSGTFIRKFLPAADSSRTTLCLIPAVTTTGQKQLAFSFPLLSGVSGQSLAIPQIRLLANQVLLPVLALPKRIDEQAVRWKKAGRRMGREWHESTGVEDAGEYEYYQPDVRQTQLNWQPVEVGKQNARVEHHSLQIRKASPTEVAGLVEYWIVPRGQIVLQLKVPESCRIIGVETGGGVASWEKKPGQLLQVMMQPNFLPINLRILAHWEIQSERELQVIELPRALIEGPASDLLVAVENSVPWDVAPNQGAQAVEPDEAIIVERWLALISSTLQSQQGLTGPETEVWLSGWNPNRVGISPQTMIESQFLTAFGDGISTEDGLSVADFWSRLIAQFGDNTTNLQSPGDDYNGFRRALVRLSPVVRLSPREASENFVPRMIAAGLVALVGLLGLVLAIRVRVSYFNLLSAQPWLYWLQLAGISWILLPVAWPSYVVAFISMAMLAGQVFDFRQKPRSLTRA